MTAPVPADDTRPVEQWYHEGYYSDRTIADHFRIGAEENGSSALHFVGGSGPVTTSLHDLYGRSRAAAAGFQAAGIGSGDIVAIWLPNGVEAAISYQAAALIGAVALPIVHLYGPAEVGYILRQSRARMLIMPDTWRSIDYLERYEALGALTDLEQVVVVGPSKPASAIFWDRIASHDVDRLKVPQIRANDVCLLIYTSGTTAEPKGVQHTHNTLFAEVIANGQIRAGTRNRLDSFPAGHIASVLNLLRMCTKGGTTVVMDRWDAAVAAQHVADYGIDSTAGAPFYLASLLDEAEAGAIDVTSLGDFLVGAASVPPALVERADAFGIRSFRAYGSSEHPTISTGRREDPFDKRAFTDGRLCPGTEVRLLDDNDVDVGMGVDGEIVSRGPELFIGYTDSRLDEASFLPGGWFRTGDIGRFDEDGFLTITDRKKDIIIRGGENIASKEVEDILARLPAVSEAAVVAKPDDRLGERVAAVVRLASGAELDLAEVRDHFVATGVAKQKIPECLVVVDELPRTASGKVRKSDLRHLVVEQDYG